MVFWRGGCGTTVFYKPASRLILSEAALLAAVLPNPLRYSECAFRRVAGRRIMRQMRQLGGESL